MLTDCSNHDEIRCSAYKHCFASQQSTYVTSLSTNSWSTRLGPSPFWMFTQFVVQLYNHEGTGTLTRPCCKLCRNATRQGISAPYTTFPGVAGVVAECASKVHENHIRGTTSQFQLYQVMVVGRPRAVKVWRLRITILQCSCLQHFRKDHSSAHSSCTLCYILSHGDQWRTMSLKNWINCWINSNGLLLRCLGPCRWTYRGPR